MTLKCRTTVHGESSRTSQFLIPARYRDAVHFAHKARAQIERMPSRVLFYRPSDFLAVMRAIAINPGGVQTLFKALKLVPMKKPPDPNSAVMRVIMESFRRRK